MYIPFFIFTKTTIILDYVRLSRNLYIHYVRLSRNLYIHYVRLSRNLYLHYVRLRPTFFQFGAQPEAVRMVSSGHMLAIGCLENERWLEVQGEASAS